MKRVHLISGSAGLLVSVLLLAGPPVASAGLTPAPRSPVAGHDSQRGTWSVSPGGNGSWSVAWRAPERLPVTDDRPMIVTARPLGALPAGTPVGVATVAEDGRTVEVAVASATEPQPEMFDVMLSGRVLDESVPGRARPTMERWTPPEQEVLGVDPGVAGTLPITSSDYDLPAISLPGIPEEVEMAGHVVEPAPEVADAADPLVLFLHGRHDPCYVPGTRLVDWRWPCAEDEVPVPSQLGYDYIQRLLASQGYVTVSIAANGINAQDGALPEGGAAARSQLVQEHLDQWATWAGEGRHRVDMDKVVLVGHSRGGEGVSQASLEIPLAAPYRVVGQVLIAPTDFAGQTTPYVPTVTILPSCDGDVFDLAGQAYTDLARDLADGDTALKSSALVVGANHNFFNTEWTPRLSAAPSSDDSGAQGGICGPRTETRLTAAEQRRVGKAYVAGAVGLFADGDQAYRPMFDGSPVHVASTRAAVTLSHAIGGDRDIRVPGSEAGLTIPVGAKSVLCKGTTPWAPTTEPLCGRFARLPAVTPHWPYDKSLVPTYEAFQMSWTSAGSRGGLALDAPLDLTGRDTLDLRTVVDPKIGDVAMQVRATDDAGASVTVEPVGGPLLPALPSGDTRDTLGRYWAQTVQVDTDDLAAIDASKVTRVELVGTSERGRVWVIDLSGVSAGLPTVPARRVPIVDLGRLRVAEGGPGPHVAEVPFTVTGDVGTPAELWVYGYWGTPTGHFTMHDRVTVPLPQGAAEGTIAWEYAGDDLDSYPRIVHTLIARPSHDVMVRSGEGRLVIVDDDPAPQMTFDAVRRSTVEGQDAVFELRLSEPVGYALGFRLHVVRGDGVPVRAHDVGVWWLKKWTNWKPHTDAPLHQLKVTYGPWMRPGVTSKRFGIPIRDDRRAEPRESLTMRITTDTGWRSDPVTVFVRPSD